MKVISSSCKTIGVLPLLCNSKGYMMLCWGVGNNPARYCCITNEKNMQIQITKSDGTIVTTNIESLAKDLSKSLQGQSKISGDVLINFLYDEIEEHINKKNG